ncbi:MAG: efflux RND transporter periplasmic adaptor subunit [Verrucomicrobiota bacterium]
MNRNRSPWRAGVMPVLVALGMSAGTATVTAQPPAKAGAAAEPVPVRVQRVAARDLERVLEYVGDIKGQDEATVYPKVPGKIAEKLKQDGDEVQKGEALALIDRDEIGFKFEKAPVESPLAGVVGRVYVDQGTSVTPQTPIALVVNLDRTKINLDIPDKYLAQIAVGQEAHITVDAYPQSFTGQVTKISPVVDLQTRTAPVEILVPNAAHELKPGMFARVRLLMERRQGVLVVLKEAILGADPDRYVYVANGGAAQQRKVRLGLRQAGEFEVLEGLQEGDLVVIMGQQRLKDGTKVAIEEESAPQGTP